MTDAAHVFSTVLRRRLGELYPAAIGKRLLPGLWDVLRRADAETCCCGVGLTSEQTGELQTGSKPNSGVCVVPPPQWSWDWGWCNGNRSFARMGYDDASAMLASALPSRAAALALSVGPSELHTRELQLARLSLTLVVDCCITPLKYTASP